MAEDAFRVDRYWQVMKVFKTVLKEAIRCGAAKLSMQAGVVPVISGGSVGETPCSDMPPLEHSQMASYFTTFFQNQHAQMQERMKGSLSIVDFGEVKLIAYPSSSKLDVFIPPHGDGLFEKEWQAGYVSASPFAPGTPVAPIPTGKSLSYELPVTVPPRDAGESRGPSSLAPSDEPNSVLSSELSHFASGAPSVPQVPGGGVPIDSNPSGSASHLAPSGSLSQAAGASDDIFTYSDAEGAGSGTERLTPSNDSLNDLQAQIFGSGGASIPQTPEPPKMPASTLPEAGDAGMGATGFSFEVSISMMIKVGSEDTGVGYMADGNKKALNIYFFCLLGFFVQ